MAADERHGVVDADCRTFAVPNLYITDGSVLPTQGSANPALTIMAVAARAADRLSPTGGPTRWRQADRRRLPAEPPARVGGGHGLRLPRRRHQRDPRRLGAGRQRAAVHPGPARGDERVRGGRLRQVHRPGRRLHGHLRAGRDPPAQRPVRRQARPRPGGRDRRADHPQRDGRLLPAGGRPAVACSRTWPSDYVQMVTVPEQLPNVLDRAIRIALAERAADRDHHPVRRAGAGVLGAGPRVQDGALQPGRRSGRR